MKKLIITLLILLTIGSTSAFAKDEHIAQRAVMMTALAVSTNVYLYSQEGPSTQKSRWVRSMALPIAYSVVKGEPELLVAYGVSSLMGVVLSETLMEGLWISVNEKFDGVTVGVQFNF